MADRLVVVKEQQRVVQTEFEMVDAMVVPKALNLAQCAADCLVDLMVKVLVERLVGNWAVHLDYS